MNASFLTRLAMKTLAVFFCLTATASAALQADTAWEVRTAGSNENGSCYDVGGSGTDYSQQDSHQLSLTDLATSGAGVTTLTSATGGFTSQMVDNCIRIRSGTNFDVGYYEITAFTDGNTVTLDRTPSAAGAGSSGAGKVGGAAADGEQVTAGVVAGNTVYIKAGTYTVAINLDTSGGGTTPITWRGYNSTRTDNPTGTNRPLIDCASSLANGIVNDAGDNFWMHLRVANCTGDGVLYSVGTTMINVSSNSNGDEGFDDSANVSLACFRCEAGSNSGFGFEAMSSATASSVSIGATYVHDNSGGGINSGAPGSVYFSVIETNGGDGVDETSSCINSVSHGNTGAGSDGFDEIVSTGYVFNCAATSNGQYGFNGTDSYGPFDFNGYNGNSTAGLNVITAGPNDVTGAPSYTDSANGDFTLQAGSPYLATGIPQSIIPGLTGDYQVNIGVDQDDNSAGGSPVTRGSTFLGGF